VPLTWFRSLKQLLLGRPKDPLDPKVFHQISLVAFLAWVGLGADRLSSSAYSAEEAYLALENFLSRLAACDFNSGHGLRYRLNFLLTSRRWDHEAVTDSTLCP
jgi:hypothetical protein